jgi:transposase-like protein
MKTWTPEARAAIAREWSNSSLCQEEFSKVHGISPRTLREWCRTYPPPGMAVEVAKEVVRDAITKLQHLLDGLSAIRKSTPPRRMRRPLKMASRTRTEGMTHGDGGIVRSLYDPACDRSPATAPERSTGTRGLDSQVIPFPNARRSTPSRRSSMSVAVGVESDLRVGVAEELRDDRERDAVLQQERRCRVPQVVEADVPGDGLRVEAEPAGAGARAARLRAAPSVRGLLDLAVAAPLPPGSGAPRPA